MISTSDLLHLPYTPDLTQGGIAYALHALPHLHKHAAGSTHNRLRKVVVEAAVQLAFRRYLSAQNIPFAIRGALPFRDPDHYDVVLSGGRCELHSFLIRQREQVAQVKHDPQVLLASPALVESDQNAAEGHSPSDIYLFAFVLGGVPASGHDLQTVQQRDQADYFVHVMPETWLRPEQWNPPGKLVLKSDADRTLHVEIGGQDRAGEVRTLEVKIPPKTRVPLEEHLSSLAYIHSKTLPQGRLGLHSPLRKQTYIIEPAQWDNIWVYGTEIVLAGCLRREEFNRRAKFIGEGAQLFPYEGIRTKHRAVNVCDLKPVAALLAGLKE